MSNFSIEITSKTFGSHQVLSGIDITLSKGEIACILGPSGCGKTTLLSILAGLDTDYQGQFSHPDGPIAMVFQNPRLLPWRTLAQNIALIPDAGGLDDARQRLAQVGLAEAADQYPEKVSVGMQRRAALARALAIRPALVLMDEPLVSLDPATAAEMRTLLSDTLRDAGVSALIATHDRREALHLADRIIELGGSPTTTLRNRKSPLDRTTRHDTQSVETAFAELFQD
ncbi:MAG: ATP-binding cassette domain-containing protein [Pseudomonadota bacterium]